MRNKYLLICILISSISYGQFVQQAKIVASDAAASDHFGYSYLGIDGDYAVIGAHQNDDGGSNSGSAYIFTRSGTSWSQQAKLTASDAAAGDYFGISAAISGDYALIGAPEDDDNSATGSGSAYIFIRSGTSWSQQSKLTASDAAASDNFGYFVDIDGDYAVVTAKEKGYGAVYIFVRSGTNWSQQAKLTASDGAAGDELGYSVSISGDYVIAGNPLDDDGGSTSGSAYIFKRSGTTWSQQAKLIADDDAAGDWFGMGVSIDGDYAVVGCWQCDTGGDTNTGAAYTFIRSGTTWSQQAKLVASDAAGNDDGGRMVAISGDYALMSASSKNTTTGAGYLFKRSGSNWSQAQKLTASDAANYDAFGFGLDLDGEYGLIGAYGNDDGGSISGSAYIFYGDLTAPTISSVYLNADSTSINQNISIAQISFTATSTGQSTLDFQSECEMLDPDGNSIEIKGFGQGVVDAQ